MHFKIAVKDKYLVVFDQALLSVINFGAFLILSKIAIIKVVSDFVVTYSYSYFIFLFSTLLFSAPILIFLPKKWEDKQGTYLSTMLLLNFVFNILIALAIYYVYTEQIQGISWYYFFLLPFCQSFFDILKKFIFSSKKIHIKWGVYATLLLNSCFFGLLFFYADDLKLTTIISIYGVSFLAASIFMLVILWMKNITVDFKITKATFKFVQKAFTTHFKYSKWIILGGISFWGYNQGIYILAKAYGVNDFIIGKIRTIHNLLGVFSILMIAFENHYTPLFASKIVENGTRGLPQMVLNVYRDNYKKVLFLFIAAIPVGLFVYNFFYGDKYGSGTTIFFVFLAIQFLLLFSRPISIALKSVEITTPFFISHLLAVLCMLVLFQFVYLTIEEYAFLSTLAMANLVYVLFIVVYYLMKRKTFV